MHRFSVWAPLANKVSVLVENAAHPMTRDEKGWWHADVAAAEHGHNYAFLLDDDAHPYPDPRSGWQPDGVHGKSRLIDHERFDWNDAGWQPPSLTDAVIYELHVGTFTPQGTFSAAEKKISYLRELGVTHVELMPVNSFPGRWGWGYDGVALFAPQEQYGGPEALKHFVSACHQAGMAVLLDVVYNHFGPVGNYTGRFGNYITGTHSTPWGGAVNLEEAGSDAVRSFFCDNAIQWLRDFHFDGLRLDAVHAFVDRSAIHFLEQMSEEVEALSSVLGRPLVLIAESDLNDPRVVMPREDGGLGMDAQWSDDFHHALFAILTGERQTYYSDFGSMAQLAKAITGAYVYDGIYSAFRRCVHGRPVENLSAHRFLGYIQNHDQVGNRAYGDRLHQVAGAEKAKIAAAIVLTSPFVPMLFQGEEFAASAPFLYFADHDDPEMARAVSEGRRREHAAGSDWKDIPDPESEETFRRSQLDWAELEEPVHAAILGWYKQLIALRRSLPDLRDGDLANTSARFDEEQRWLEMRRGSVRVLCNMSDHEVRIDLDKAVKSLLASSGNIRFEAGAVVLPPVSVAITVDA